MLYFCGCKLLTCEPFLIVFTLQKSLFSYGSLQKLRKDGRRFSIVHGQDLLRLEYLSACKVMQDRETTARLLPAVPHKLYPALFEAAILHSFYSSKF